MLENHLLDEDIKRYGYICQICGEEVECYLYYDCIGDLVGCDQCIEVKDVERILEAEEL